MGKITNNTNNGSKNKKCKSWSSSSKKRNEGDVSDDSENNNNNRVGRQKNVKNGSTSKNKKPYGPKYSRNYNNSHRSNKKFDDALQRAIEADGTKSVIEMAADGNCLFRALSDQLYNDYGNHHVEVRDDVVDYMEGHKEDFCFFLVLDDKDSNDEDASDFESYCNEMRRDGTWGGNLELVAASKMYRRNITVFSSDLAALNIHHESGKTSSGPDLLLSYHDNDHYNSVRINNPSTKKLPLPIRTYEKYDSKTISSDPNGYRGDEGHYCESTNNCNFVNEERLVAAVDDEASTTDTDSSRQSSNNASILSHSTTATTDTARSVATAATAETASTVGSQSIATSSSVSSIRTAQMSTSSTGSSDNAENNCSKDVSCVATQQLGSSTSVSSASSISCRKKEMKSKKNRGIPRINKIIRGYKKVSDDDNDEERESNQKHNDKKSKTAITTSTKKKRNYLRSAPSAFGSSDDESVGGQFRVLKI